MTDIIVIGAGPAGLTAALYAARANKSVTVLEKGSFGGQINFSPKIENYPGTIEITGAELADKLVEQALSQGVDIELSEVVGIEDKGNFKKVITDDGEYEAKAVIIATGARHRHLGVEGEREFEGNGISFCAVCDGAFYSGQRVAVIGGGNSALQEALLLSELCLSVVVIQNLETFTGEEKLVKLLEAKPNVKALFGKTVKKFEGSDKLEKVIITGRDGDEEIAVDGVFVAIGLKPENESFENVCALDKVGYVVSDEACTTKTEGVFVAGDCRTKTIRQIATAVSDGAVAALSAVRYIDLLSL